jgi:hypothetical protein
MESRQTIVNAPCEPSKTIGSRGQQRDRFIPPTSIGQHPKSKNCTPYQNSVCAGYKILREILLRAGHRRSLAAERQRQILCRRRTFCCGSSSNSSDKPQQTERVMLLLMATTRCNKTSPERPCRKFCLDAYSKSKTGSLNSDGRPSWSVRPPTLVTHQFSETIFREKRAQRFWLSLARNHNITTTITTTRVPMTATINVACYFIF